MEVQDCAKLASRTKFSDYIALLRNATHNDFSLVNACGFNICGALWGSGNPDISGNGMTVGYLIETVLCSIIVGVHIWYTTKRRKHESVAKLLLSNASRAFYDTASFFNLAIQIACIVTLARADWDMGADGMGGITKEITWLVSSLSLLPLVVIILRPRLCRERESAVTHSEIRRSKSPSTPTPEIGSPLHKVRGSETSALAKAREDQRVVVFVVCWALAFCPFFSRMGGTFGVSKIGNSSGAVISDTDWSVIENTCFEGVKTMNASQKHLITAFGMISYFLVTFVVLQKIIASATEGQHKEKRPWINRLNAMFDEESIRGTGLWLVVSGLVVLLLVIQLWAFFRFRRLQSDMVKAAGGDPPDEQWSFGQVVAIAIFLPVATEVVFVWRKRSFYLVAEHDELNALDAVHGVLGSEEVK